MHKPYQNPNSLHFASVSIGYLPTSTSTIHAGVITLTLKISFKNQSCSFEITSIFSHAHISQPYKRIGCTRFPKSSISISSGKFSCQHFLNNENIALFASENCNCCAFSNLLLYYSELKVTWSYVHTDCILICSFHILSWWIRQW